MKSEHIFYNGIIPYNELNNFIEPITITIPIPLMDLKSIGGNKQEDFYNKYKSILTRIIKCLPSINEKLDEKYLDNIAILSYTPHKDKYDFRVNPIGIINSIFKTLGINETIPFFNLDDEQNKKAFKEYTKRIICKLEKSNLSLAKELEDISNNLDFLNTLYNYDIEKDIRKHNYILAKDALLYLSYSSLLEYNKTRKREYLRIPYEYYHHIGHMETSAFPHKIRVGYSSPLWFDDFMTFYKTIVGESYIPVFNEFALHENTLVCGWEILKSGDKEETFREVNESIIRVRNGQNDERNLKMFLMKTNFYANSKYNTMIKGKFGLNGYIGFVYPNDYIVYDKIYNNEDVPNDKKTILSHPEAIYSIPSDRIIVTAYDKQKLKEIKGQDPRIVKTNHTISGSFINRLENIVKGPNVSTKSFDEVVKEESNKLLILR